jgi:uncharacterized membrane protein YqaE (UPF0057 family)|tara:strand:- start:1389 stop:1685 length:297 start_codon:yes stop_codon:yes gene_type:complete
VRGGFSEKLSGKVLFLYIYTWRGPLNHVTRAYIQAMNYVLALLLPPLSILLTGRIFTAIIVFLIWIPAVIFSGGLTHPMFIILAWILIYQTRQDRQMR